MDTNYNRIKVADLETNQPNKILKTNENGELEFSNISNLKTDNYNGLDYTEEGKALDARQGKVLRDLISSNGNTPYLDELIPNHFLPNITNNIIVKGSFFTPETNISIQGQVVNYIKFKSDNEILINVTTGSAEGSFDVILNNGKSITYTEALTIMLGTVFKPAPQEWNTTNLADISEGDSVKIVTYNSAAQAIWSKEIDNTKNFRINFRAVKSPLGNPQAVAGFVGLGNPEVHLINKSNSEPVLIVVPYLEDSRPHGGITVATPAEGQQTYIDVYDTASLEATSNEREKRDYSIRHINGVLYLYRNATLIKTFIQTLSEKMQIKINVKLCDIDDLKYIETP